ncbi:hypothetical protein TNCV_403641 [Trichonephila clavipes]|nr:hypothetical protein TNCV_403641 [Trichonephila clavipes]
MMWFVREEFLVGVRSQRRLSDHFYSLSLSLSSLPSGIGGRRLFSSSYIRLVGKRISRGVKGCRGDPRLDHVIILKLQVQNARVVIRKDADSQLCGGKFTVASQLLVPTPGIVTRGVNASCLMLEPCADIRVMANAMLPKERYFIGLGKARMHPGKRTGNNPAAPTPELP